MARIVTRVLLVFGVAVLGLWMWAARGDVAPPPAVEAGAPAAPTPQRSVFLVGKLGEEDTIAFSTNLAASGRPEPLLLDMPKRRDAVRRFLDAYKADEVVPVGPYDAPAVTDLTTALERSVAAPAPWDQRPSAAFWKRLFDKADRVVLCPVGDRRLLLQSAALAGALHAPLLVSRGGPAEAADYRRLLADWNTGEIYAAGAKDDTAKLLHDLPKIHIFRLADEAAVVAAVLRHLQAAGPVQTLVVVNPADGKRGSTQMSLLAPWLATTRHGLLLLTDEAGGNTSELVAEAVTHSRVHAAENLIIAADLQSIPVERRANPVEGKDAFIEMEPLTPQGDAPFSFSTGRLFHEDPGVVCLQLARQRLLDAVEPGSPRKALLVSDPGGELPLLGMFSHTTLRELRNRGYETTAMFGNQITSEDVRRDLPKNDIFLWEGHHSTLIKQYQFPEWTEPLPPSLVFLQSCMALTDSKTHHLLERGAVAVVGTSTRTFSGSGGAFSLAYFDALMYDGKTLGGSLRQAKNFMLCYAMLKDKRLGKDAKLTGANQRSSWAFTLWGDPALKLPAPAAPADALDAVRAEVQGNSVVVTLPDSAFPKITSGKFNAEMRPNGRLAGLISRDEDDQKRLVPFIFAEVALPKGPAHRTPHLHGKVPESHWVFAWDERRKCGYLLVTPRPHDQRELRFHISWDEEPAAGAATQREERSPAPAGGGR